MASSCRKYPWPDAAAGTAPATKRRPASGWKRAARTYAYETLGWKTAVSYIDAPNARSIAPAERLGAQAPGAGRDAEVLVFRHPAPVAIREARP